MSKKKTNPYNELLTELSTLYDNIIGPGVRERNKQLVHSYWKIGKRIVDELQGGKATAKYGKNVIYRLSADLSKKYGKGFGRRNLFYIRNFASEYPVEKFEEELSWTHYRMLLSISDRQLRAQVEKQALEQHLSCSALKKLVSGFINSKVGKGEFPLVPRNARTGLYKVSVDNSGKKTVIMLDCGFNVLRKVKIKGVSNLKDGEIIMAGKSSFKRIECKRGERYCYDATVLNVVDGDTIAVLLDLGQDCVIKERMRLRGVNAPEMNCKNGVKARNFVCRRLKKGSRVRIFTYGHDRYGRYVADVLYADNNKYLNKELVKKGVANFLDMGVY